MNYIDKDINERIANKAIHDMHMYIPMTEAQFKIFVDILKSDKEKPVHGIETYMAMTMESMDTTIEMNFVSSKKSGFTYCFVMTDHKLVDEEDEDPNENFGLLCKVGGYIDFENDKENFNRILSNVEDMFFNNKIKVEQIYRYILDGYNLEFQ